MVPFKSKDISSRLRTMWEWPYSILIRSLKSHRLSFMLVTCVIIQNCGDTQIADDCVSTLNENKICYIGNAFAECPGRNKPMAYCAEYSETHGKLGDGRCKWISNGCPLENYKTPLDPKCQCNGMKCGFDLQYGMSSFVESFGISPLSRFSHLNIQIKYNGNTPATSPHVICYNCAYMPCSSGSTPCSDSKVYFVRAIPGTLSLRFFPSYLMGGWFLEIEADTKLEKPKGRICLRHFSDNKFCVPQVPTCAIDGTIEFDHKESQIDLDKVHGSFNASFENGMSVKGTF